jgi:hypothetical protein
VGGFVVRSFEIHGPSAGSSTAVYDSASQRAAIGFLGRKMSLLRALYVN